MRAATAALGAALMIAAGACSSGRGGDEKSVRRERGASAATAPAATAAPATAGPANAAVCLVGRFRFVSQEYSGPVDTIYGPTVVEGGEAGRTIELASDGTFRFADDGSEPVSFALQSTDPPTTGTAKLVAQSGGTYTATGGTATFDVVTLSGSLTLTLSGGQIVDVPLPPDGAGVEKTFGLTGAADIECGGNRVSAEFEKVTVELERI